MSNVRLRKPRLPQGVAPPAAHGVATEPKRRQTMMVYFGLAAVVVSIAAAAGLAALLRKPPANEIVATNSATNRLGSIVRHLGADQCQRMTFDNNTGQI